MSQLHFITPRNIIHLGHFTNSLAHALKGIFYPQMRKKGILESLKDSHFSLNAGAGIGGEGKRTFNYKTRALGTSKIYLRLRREWEPEKRVIDQFEVIIQATKKGD